MTPLETLAGPVVEAREIVESYRWGRVEVHGWPETLRKAEAALRLAQRGGAAVVSGVRLETVADELALLASQGLGGRGPRLTDLSRHLEALVRGTRPAGFPAPEDPDVSF
jgi:hypothetical protein